MTIAPIQPINLFGAEAIQQPSVQSLIPHTSFAQSLVDGINGVSDKLTHADGLVRAFALDDSIPVHQVTYALEEARLSFELMLQVRSRLLDGYQQLMNMQL